MYNSDSGRKVQFPAKKKGFFLFFQFSLDYRGCQKFLNVHFFENVYKNSKNGFTGTWQMLRGLKS